MDNAYYHQVIGCLHISGYQQAFCNEYQTINYHNLQIAKRETSLVPPISVLSNTGRKLPHPKAFPPLVPANCRGGNPWQEVHQTPCFRYSSVSLWAEDHQCSADHSRDSQRRSKRTK